MHGDAFEVTAKIRSSAACVACTSSVWRKQLSFVKMHNTLKYQPIIFKLMKVWVTGFTIDDCEVEWGLFI